MRLRPWLTGVGLVLGLFCLLGGAPAVAAGPYPPPNSTGGAVNPSTVDPGGCVVFSGHGFSPNTTITITDNGKFVGTTQTNQNGEFAKRVCFASDAKPGKHTLVGTGQAPSGSGSGTVTARVSAVVFLKGVTETDNSGNGGGAAGAGSGNGSSSGNGGGLAFTGFPAIATAVAGTTLVAVGGLMLIATERRHRRRRRPRLA